MLVNDATSAGFETEGCLMKSAEHAVPRLCNLDLPDDRDHEFVHADRRNPCDNHPDG